MPVGVYESLGGVRPKVRCILFVVLASLALGQARAAVTLVQHAGRDAGTTTSSTLAFPSNNTAGNFIAVAIRAGKTGQNFTVTDTRNNTYRRALQASETLDPVTLAIYYAESIAGGANTVTVTDTVNGGTLRFAILEYAGVATSSALDGTPVMAEGSSAALSSGPTTTTAAGDLVLGVFSTSESATHTAGAGATIQERVPASAKLAVQDQVQAAAGPIAAAASIAAAQPWAAAVAAFKAAPTGPPVPDLTIAKTHAGSFTLGQSGAVYTITVSNVGTGATAGTVTVTDALPVSGLTATGISGTGWGCTLSPLSCSRSDALAAGGSYPPITLTVDVSPSAPASVINTATVSGGGETSTSNDTASDPTAILAAGVPDLSVSKTHAGSFTQGQTGATYTITASNVGTAATSGTVTMADTLPVSGLTATGLSGTGWSCTLSPLSCSRGDALAAGGSYPSITLTVSVAPTAPAAVTNAASVSGGGQTNTANDTASDPTTIAPSGGGPAPIALVQHAGRDAGTTTSSTLAFPSNNTAGNFIAVAIRAGNTGQNFTVTDTRNNTYRRALQANETLDTVTLGLYYAENIAVGPNTVTVTDTISGGTLRFAIFEYSGVATSSSLDGTALMAEGSSTAPSSGSITTSAAGDLIFGMISTSDSATYTAGAGAVIQERVPAAPSTKLVVEDRVLSTAGAASAAATVAPTQAWAAVVAAFRAAGGGPVPGADQVGQWSAVQSWPIVAVHASLLPTGDVLAWTDYTANSGAQIWRRGTSTFVPKTYSPVSLFCAGHAWLPDGRLMVTGGIVGLQDDLGPRETTVFDPGTESWSAGPLMAQGRYYPTTTTLPDGRLLVAGGTTTCVSCVADGLEIYDPDANTWAPMAASARQAFKYYPHLYVLPDGKVLLAGEDDKAIGTQVLDLTTQSWTTVDPRIIDGHSSAMYLPGKVMKCGKATADAPGNAALATTYVLDMTQGSPAWVATPSMAFPRSHHNLTILPDGQVLVTGGGRTTDKADLATAVLQAELWNPTTQAWSTMAAMQNPRLYHSTALLLPDATVLVAGGGRQNGRSQLDPKDQQNAQIYSPPYLFRGPRPVITSSPSLLTYGTDFQVSTPDAARIGSVSLIPLGAVTHSFNQTQRFVPLAFTAQAGAITVTPPADGNTAPPGYYMLFLVDTAGVPSVAAMARLPKPGNDTQPPTAPGTPQAPVAGANVNLTWSASIDNVAVTGYNVHRSTTSGFTPAPANRIAQPSSTSYTDTPPAPGTYFYKVTAQDARGNVSQPSGEATATIVPAGVPDLSVSKTHAGSFTQGQTGATYTITVSNVGTAATSGTVTMADTLPPSGLTATGLSGTGWSCTLSPLSCSRANALAAGGSYPSITLTVSVAPTAPASVTNTASVSGGGQTNTANDTASDPTTILAAGVPDLSVSKTHVGSFTQGQTGATYTITVSNVGTAATSGTVTMADTLPPSGLTATGLSGTGWSCTLSPLSCSRANALAAGGSYPSITLTVSVAPTAPASVTNAASVSGGGQTNTANDTASDPTTIAPSGGGPASIALVQHAGRDAGTTTSSTLAFPSNNTAGNFIAVAIRAGKNGQNFTVTDTRNNTYRRALQANETLDTVTLGLYYAENIAGGPNTVTVADTVNGGTLRIAVFEYSGVATSSSLDGTALMAEGSSTAPSSGSITTSAGGDLIFGMISTAESATYTAGGGAVIQERVPAAPSTKLAVEDRVQSTAGAASATATIAPTQAWAAVVAAFKAAAGPGPNAPKLIVTSPAEGGAVPGSTLPVAYTWTGDLSEVNHVHFQLDADPVVMDLSFDGVFQYTGLHVGAHTLNGVLVRSDHSTIIGSDAVPVHFTTVVDPADPTVPNVQITAPAGGTVSGVTTILANASDNLGVYGVQFKLDGALLGAEDLVAPYGTDWNTATANNGVHTLTAVARDVAGNERTSATVTVTVSNVSPTDPSVIGQFAGPFSWPLVSVHGILLPTGKVLLYDDHTTSAGVQVWNPATGSLTSRPYNANNLFCSGHTLLPDGRVLAAGGHVDAYVGIEDTTIFNPATETWSAAAPMAQARWYPTTTSLPDGRVLVISGADNCPTCVDPNGTHTGIALVPEIYDPRVNTWTPLPGASLSLPLYPHMHVLPDGRVLAVASQEDPIVSRALNIATQTWTTFDPVARDGGSSVMYRPGKILKTGKGRNPDYAPVPSSATAYVMDATAPSPTWRAVAPMSFARTQHNLVVLPDGNVLAVGGSTNTNVYDTPGCVKTAEMWDAVAETWRSLATMQEPRHYHSIALLLPDGRVLVAGGGRFGPDFPSAEIYSPPYLFKGPRPAITSVAPLQQFNSHFNVGTPDGARIAKVTLLRLGAPTHGFDENQRYVELGFTPIAGALDVTAPTSPNVAPPGHYMLFLVDTSGVPSVGSVVRLPAPWEDTISPSAPGGLAGVAQTGMVDLTWTAASDNTGVALYNIHRGTLPGLVPTTANRVGQSATLTFRDTGFGTGNYVYVVTAQDVAGNVGAPSSEFGVFLQADVTPPSSTLTAPSSGATLTGVTTLQASASDDIGVAGVQFLLDGGILGAEDTASPYSLSWNSGLAPNGPHAIAARARDAAGNPTTSAPAAVTLANVVIPGLAAAYSFDDGSGTLVRDSSTFLNNGTVAGATWTTSGHTLGALSYTPNTYVQVPAAPSLDISGKGLTIEMWANITLSGSVDYVLVGKPWTASGQAYPYYQYGIEYDTNGSRTLDFYFGDTAGQARGPFQMTPVTGAWTHIAYTYDGTSVKGYLNGTLALTASATTDIQARGTVLRIGVDGALQQGYRGLIDDLRIYNRALTSAEIQQDMASPVILP